MASNDDARRAPAVNVPVWRKSMRPKEPGLWLVAQKDLTVLYHIQRVPKDAAIRKLRREWEDDKAGVLLVALLTDGASKGALHVYDGGTRWMAKGSEPTYRFYCFIKPMTEQDAARATWTFNNEQRRHSAYQSHLVGVAAEFPLSLSLKNVLDRVGLEPWERSSTRERFAAIKAGERILKDTYAKTFAHKGGTLLYPKDTTDDERWDIAIERLLGIIHLMREAYSDATAHDGDMIQAVAALWSLNADKLEQSAVRERLIGTLSERTVAYFRIKAQEEHQTYGGSESRGKTMARIVGREFNWNLRDQSMALVRPRTREEILAEKASRDARAA